MSFKSTALLALTLFVLCGVYVGMKYLAVKKAVEQIQESRLFQFEASQITELAITRVGEPTSKAVRDDQTGWRIVEPSDTIIAFPMLWERVAAHLTILSSARTIAQPAEDSSQYGLMEPALTVAFRLAGQPEPTTLAFGDLTPTQQFRYACKNGGEIFLVHKDAFFELDRPLDQLRSRFLVDDRESPILHFEFARIAQGTEKTEEPLAPGTESVLVTLERDNPQALWRLTSPIESGADQALAQGLVAAVQYAVGWGFVDHPEALSDYGLDPPGARVTVIDAGKGRRQTIYFGHVDATGEKQGMYVKRDDNPAVFLIDASILGQFPRTPEMFRDRRLLTVPLTEAQRITYEGPGGQFVLERNGAKRWELVPADTGGIDQQAVSAFLAALNSVDTLHFPEGSPAQYGLDTPLVRIVVDSGDTRPPAEIRLAPYPQDEAVYAALADAGFVALVAKDKAEALLVSPADFASRDLLRFNKELASRLEFTFEATAYDFEKVHGAWLVKAPAGKRLANQSDAQNLLDALTPLRAQGVESASREDLPALGLDAPLFTIRITTNDPANPDGPQSTGLLSVGNTTPDNSQQRYAELKGRPGLFLVNQQLIDTVRDALRGIE